MLSVRCRMRLCTATTMPLRTSLQVVLGGLGAVAILTQVLASTFTEKPRRIVGTISTSGSQLVVAADNGKKKFLEISSEASVVLNAVPVNLNPELDGRRATVQYTRSKGQLLVTHVDVFPRHEDFKAEADDNPQSA